MKGVEEFLDFAFAHIEVEGIIPCPCNKSNKVLYKSKYEVKSHSLMFGMFKGYTHWLYHGVSREL